MIINSLDKQIILAENGNIMWQKDLTDPRPGEVFAHIKKGTEPLNPDCALIDTDILEGQDKEATLEFTKNWLKRHIKAVLEPLFRLKEENIADGAPQQIANKIYDALGILPREELQELIDQMSEEGRNTLRGKKIRFGPIIVYLPELNKPAGVAMQALLLSLWEGKELPAEKPIEGIVSFSIEGKDINPEYYRAIGYPVFGPRSIRVDMLDRVICAVYDSADKGKFKAQHQMAEWLGCNIADLYAVLEAMGHRKIYDPADEPEKGEDKKDTAENTEESQKSEKSIASEENKDGTDIEQKPKESTKPELATFVLKSNKPKPQSSSHNNKFKDKNFSSKPKKFNKNKSQKSQKPQGQRVFKAEAETKPEDSPFAILEQLKSSGKDK